MIGIILKPESFISENLKHIFILSHFGFLKRVGDRQ